MEILEPQTHDPISFPPMTTVGAYTSFGHLFNKVYPTLEFLESNINCFDHEPPFDDIQRNRHLGDILPIDPLGRDGNHHAFEIVGHQLAMTVLKNGELFSASIYKSVPGASVGETMLMMDGDAHTALRASLKGIFKFSTVEAYKTDIFRPLAHRLIDAFPTSKPFDLISAFTFEFPARCLSQIVGFPEDDEPWIHSRTIELLCVGFDRSRAIAARRALSAYFTPLLRQDPELNRGSLKIVGSLCKDGTLQEEEAISFIRLLLLAGTETSFRSISNLFATMLTQEGLWERLRAEPSLIKKAVAESLRWEPASFDVHRVATQDTTLQGQFIPKGSRVSINRLSVNRDERIYSDPHTFDLDRPPSFNFAFSAGAHHCIGLGIAQAEMQTALEVVLERCPNLTLDPSQPPPRIQGYQFRRPKHIPVLLSPNGGLGHAL